MTGLAMSEADLQTTLLAAARLHGWRAVHFRPARTSRGWATPYEGDDGFLDLVLAKAGRVLIAELKSPRGGFRPGQREWLAAVGAHARLWRPADLPAALAELAGHAARVPVA